jgi:hypothetical protein
MATASGRILPAALQAVNTALSRVRPEGDAARNLDKVRSALADVAVAKVQAQNRIRVIQAAATRGSGMSKRDLDQALEQVVQELHKL